MFGGEAIPSSSFSAASLSQVPPIGHTFRKAWEMYLPMMQSRWLGGVKVTGWMTSQTHKQELIIITLCSLLECLQFRRRSFA